MKFDTGRLIELSPDAHAVLDEDGRLLEVNPAFEHHVGGKRQEWHGRPLADLAHPDDRAAGLAQLQAARTGGSAATFTMRVGCGDGEYRRLHWTVYPDPSAGVLYTVARAVEEAQPDQEVLRVAMEVSPCGLVVVDQEGTIVFANAETERLFGFDRGELLGRPVEVLVPNDLAGGHEEHRRRYHDAPDARPMGRGRHLTGRRRDGTTLPVEIGLNPVRTAQGTFTVGAITDLTERKRSEERMLEQSRTLQALNDKLAEMASTDSLTSLWNRRAFFDQLRLQLELMARHARPISILLVDLDHFKPFNDEFGHLAGDDVLRRVARILLGEARRSDYVARLGGEEFGIILPETDDHGSILLGERFRAAVEGADWPLRPITASIGATTVQFPKTASRRPLPSHSQILTEADRALYEAKAAGRNRVSHAGLIAVSG